jgi:hypothetical protein
MGGDLQVVLQIGEGTPKRRVNGGRDDTEQFGYFGLRPGVAVHENDDYSLLFAQSFESGNEARLKVADLVVARDGQVTLRPTTSSRCCLTDSVEIAGRIRHRKYTVTVLPAVGERLGRCVYSDLGAIGRDQPGPESAAVIRYELLERHIYLKHPVAQNRDANRQSAISFRDDNEGPFGTSVSTRS